MPSNQRRVVLAPSGRAPLLGARKIGPADPNQQLEVTPIDGPAIAMQDITDLLSIADAKI